MPVNRGKTGFFAARNYCLPPPARLARYHAIGETGRYCMHIEIVSVQAITPLLALIFGILILVLPKFLNYLVAVYLIILGLIGLFPHLFTTTTT
jgi:Protein of unknown function (DUF3096)